MNKNKLLIISVVVLVVLNITLIVVLTLGHSPRPPHMQGHQNPKEIIIERLHFDATQVEAYNEIIAKHREQIGNKEHEMRIAKEALYHSLSSDNQDEKDELIAKINILQKDFEEIHYNHFLEIKKLCKPEQIKNYNELTDELAKIFAPHPEPPRR
tara:strand:+ start:840 stop:1304 length:465 start_codon:yes stop_codon:yes gene_type:complete